jgi:hypothetical protein
MMNLDNVLWVLDLLVEAALVGFLFYRRAWRTIPAFVVFCIWETFSNAGGFVVFYYFHSQYPLYYLFSEIADSILEFAVLVELTWSVLRPMRASLSRRTPLAIAVIILLLAAAIWPFSGLRSLASPTPAFAAIAHVQQTTAVLRVFIFLALAGCSQLLSIGWRDRELQIATGLGFYSLASLGTAMLETHQATWTQWRHLNQYLLGSYICSLIYLVFCFAQKEAQRREFTPQMQSLLLAVAGAARAERTALVEATKQEKR